MSQASGHNNLFEMLKSFCTLAETLNVTVATRQLNTTRQRIRRHVEILEKSRGQKFFETIDNQYILTVEGEEALREAQDIMGRGEAWFVGATRHENKLDWVSSRSLKDNFYYLQHHELGQLWEDGAPMLRAAFRNWAMGNAALDSPEMERLRPYAFVFRQHHEGWICVDMGEKCALTRWFGWTWAKSSIGNVINSASRQPFYAGLITRAYDDAIERGGARLDHIYTKQPYGPNRQLLSVGYQRIILSSKFADGEQGLVIFSAISHDIRIEGVNSENAGDISEDLLLKCNPTAEELAVILG